jgi:hypothetical protein
MKVLDLRCAHGHGFEGWFASEDDYQLQQQRELLECPLCGDKGVTRLPSAPRLNLAAAREPAVAARAGHQPVAQTPPQGMPPDVQAAWLRVARHLMEHTEDVGTRFAEEARRIHYGETEARGIRGQVSNEEREALHDEGIETVSLPLPAALKGGPVQ